MNKLMGWVAPSLSHSNPQARPMVPTGDRRLIDHIISVKHSHSHALRNFKQTNKIGRNILNDMAYDNRNTACHLASSKTLKTHISNNNDDCVLSSQADAAIPTHTRATPQFARSGVWPAIDR